jgi:hypothetical protein
LKRAKLSKINNVNHKNFSSNVIRNHSNSSKGLNKTTINSSNVYRVPELNNTVIQAISKIQKLNSSKDNFAISNNISRNNSILNNLNKISSIKSNHSTKDSKIIQSNVSRNNTTNSARFNKSVNNTKVDVKVIKNVTTNYSNINNHANNSIKVLNKREKNVSRNESTLIKQKFNITKRTNKPNEKIITIPKNTSINKSIIINQKNSKLKKSNKTTNIASNIHKYISEKASNFTAQNHTNITNKSNNSTKIVVGIPKNDSSFSSQNRSNSNKSIERNSSRMKEFVTLKKNRKRINWNKDFVLTQPGKGKIHFALKSDQDTKLYLSPRNNSLDMYEIIIWDINNLNILIFKYINGQRHQTPICVSSRSMKEGNSTFTIIVDEIKKFVGVYQNNLEIISCFDKPLIKNLTYFSFDSDMSLSKIRTENLATPMTNSTVKKINYIDLGSLHKHYRHPSNTLFYWKNQWSLPKIMAGSVSFSSRGNKNLIFSLSQSVEPCDPKFYFILGAKDNSVSYSVIANNLISRCNMIKPLENTDQLNEYMVKIYPDNKVLIYENNQLQYSCLYKNVPSNLKYFSLGDFKNSFNFYNIQMNEIN